jgi:hypothetical protein
MDFCILFAFLAFFTMGINAVKREVYNSRDLFYTLWYGLIALGSLISAILQIVAMVAHK